MNPRTSTRIVPTACVMALALAATSAHAGWTERGATIARLDEVLPRLTRAIHQSVHSTLAADAPVLLPDGADLSDPKTLAVALAQSGYAFRQEQNAWTLRNASRSEADRARARLRVATPTRPARGDRSAIATGAVAVFGRWLEAPFRVTRVDESIQVNGITIFPSPGPDVAPPTPSTAQVDAHTRIRRALATYPALRAQIGIPAAQAQILADLKTLSGYSRMEWVDDQNLRMVQANGVEEMLSFEIESAAVSPTPAERQEQLDTMVTGFADLLSNGGAILAGATYLSTLPDEGHAFHDRALEIRVSTEPEALKLARLQAWTAQRDAAADLLFAH